MTRFALILALLFCAPTAAQACVILGLDKFSEQDWRAVAADVVKKAAVIVDGEVTRAQGSASTFAVIRAHKVLKGPRRKAFLVDGGPSCDVPMIELGQRGRFVLSGGPERYRALFFPVDAKLIDEVLGNDRRADPWLTNSRTKPVPRRLP